jgi:hypothetical protein
MRAVLALTFFVLAVSTGVSSAEPPKIIGSWKVEVSFASGEARSLRFDAQNSGKGAFTLLIPKAVSVGQAEGSGEWSKSDNGTTTFSGPVQFPLGNVGLLRGKLVLRGQLQPDNSIMGEASFFRSDSETKDPENQPSKRGTFKATLISQ